MLIVNRRRFVYGSGSVLAAPGLARAQTAEIAVGACLPLTGPLARQAEQAHAALKLAQDEINAGGGLAGRKLKIVFEDTQASGGGAAKAFAKLVKEIDPPLMFLSGAAAQVLAVEAIAAKAMLPVMHAAGADDLQLRQNPYLFRLRPNDTVMAAALCLAVTRQMKAKRPGLLFVDDEFGRASARFASAQFAAAGLETAAMEAYDSRDDDVSRQLLRIKASGADAIAAFTHIRDGALAVSGRRALGIDLPMAVSGGTADKAALALLAEADLTNLYTVVDAVVDGAEDQRAAAYAKRFRSRAGLAPDASGASYYDGAMMLAQAIRRGGAERGSIRAALAGIDGYQGVAQTYRTDAAGNMAHAAAIAVFRPGTKDLALVDTFALT